MCVAGLWWLLGLADGVGTRGEVLNLIGRIGVCNVCNVFKNPAARRRSLEDSVKQQPGVVEVTVNLLMKQACVKFRPEQVGPRDLMGQINDSGFEADLWCEDDVNLQAEFLRKDSDAWFKRSILAIILSIPVVVMSMMHMVPGEPTSALDTIAASGYDYACSVKRIAFVYGKLFAC